MKSSSSHTPPGREAEAPTEIPAKGWWQILKRVWKQLDSDQIQIVSAGIAFYLFLSIFPILSATVASYGLVTDATEAERQIAGIQSVIPAEAFAAISEMIRAIASEADDTLGWSVFISIVLSIWSANKGTSALVKGLNIAYDETETRGFFRLKLLTLGMTLGTFAVLALVIGLVAGIPVAIGLLPLSEATATAVSIIRWPLLAILVMLVLAGVYRWTPDRDAAKWQWVSPGAIIASALWLVGSALFSIYVEKFASMAKTYGPFAAVVTLMLWLFISVYIVLLGAEINGESELQTAKDSTVGPPDPMGQRGAFPADHVVSSDGAPIQPDRESFS